MKTAISQVRAATSRSGFTMVEIALCLAIIGFALVAIIGVLPAGLNVQKQNREETILNQDSTVWMDAIRSGSFGYDELTNYVDRIVVSNFYYSAAGVPINPPGQIIAQHGGSAVTLDTGAKIVGLLSTPRIVVDPVTGDFSSNVVVAYCRAISGNAVEKSPQQGNAEIRDTAFAYRMSVDVVPAGSIDPENIETNATDVVLRRNLSDIRLFMRWPLKKPINPADLVNNPPVGDSSRITFRTQASGMFAVYSNLQVGVTIPFYFIQPREFR